jgi:hypothetical protein
LALPSLRDLMLRKALLAMTLAGLILPAVAQTEPASSSARLAGFVQAQMQYGANLIAGTL